MGDEDVVLTDLEKVSSSLKEILDDALRAALERRKEADFDSPEERQADGEVKQLHGWIARNTKLGLQVNDLMITRSGLIEQLKKNAKAAADEAARLKQATARLSEIGSLIDRLTKFVGTLDQLI